MDHHLDHFVKWPFKSSTSGVVFCAVHFAVSFCTVFTFYVSRYDISRGPNG